MYNLSCHSSYQRNTQTRVGVKSGGPSGTLSPNVVGTGYSNNEDEKKAIDIYRQMVKKAGLEVRGFGLFGDGDGALLPQVHQTRQDT